ncbi:hypothetical protein PTTG_04380 [Puccinia triticina 1-1 BBBD Race 1]|uniref:Uncharacterized protein n=1 Tax=Puccinia triticina (isolate 1-1 / race 1 (BBBD)) TaxID=630390 RepID=A0A0C4EUA1_PUCT1|nr:hypothetical protein PTTG_04380 [Puccinia triticina 1-1 BBBD Race 1]
MYQRGTPKVYVDHAALLAASHKPSFPHHWELDKHNPGLKATKCLPKALQKLESSKPIGVQNRGLESLWGAPQRAAVASRCKECPGAHYWDRQPELEGLHLNPISVPLTGRMAGDWARYTTQPMGCLAIQRAMCMHTPLNPGCQLLSMTGTDQH